MLVDTDGAIHQADAGVGRLATPMAVGSEPLIRIWAGGLASIALDLSASSGCVTKHLLALDTHAEGRGAPMLRELYDIEVEAVGKGGFGIAFLARHMASNTPCIVKMVCKAAAGETYKLHLADGGLYECFLRMTRDTPHANVVHYFDFLEGSEYYYVVMERLPGIELFQQVVEGTTAMTELYCRHVMKQVLASLHHLHDTVGIFHRDVKLDNFRYRGESADADLVLLDLGLARFIDGPRDRNIAGTLMYLAPEISRICATTDGRGETDIETPEGHWKYSASVDLWSSGVILYVLLSGRAPFSDPEVWALGRDAGARDQLHAKALEAPELRSVSVESKELLKQLMCIDPEVRITARAALDHPWFLLPADALQRPIATKEAYWHTREQGRQSEVLSRQAGRYGSNGDLYPKAFAQAKFSLSRDVSDDIPYFGD